jgi:hypothetical protein
MDALLKLGARDGDSRSASSARKSMFRGDGGVSQSNQPLKNNGLFFMRFLSVLGLVVNVGLCGLYCTMALIKGADLSIIADNYSTSLMLLAFSSVLMVFGSLLDCYKTWKIAQDKTEHISWDAQHSAFKRALMIFCAHALLLFPTLVVFVLHSTGNNFWYLFRDMSQDDQELVTFHIATYLFVVLAGIGATLVVRHSLRHRFDAEWEPVSTMPSLSFIAATKFVSAWSIFAVLIFLVSLIRTNDKQTNSGTVITTVIDCASTGLIIFYAFISMMRMEQTKMWYLAFRAAHALNQAVAYLAFWIGMLSLILSSAPQIRLGFFKTVSRLSSLRRAVVFWQIGLFLLLALLSLYRIFIHKLKKQGRSSKHGDQSRAGSKAGSRVGDGDAPAAGGVMQLQEEEESLVPSVEVVAVEVVPEAVETEVATSPKSKKRSTDGNAVAPGDDE